MGNDSARSPSHGPPHALMHLLAVYLKGKAQPSMQTPEEVQQIGDAQPTAG